MKEKLKDLESEWRKSHRKRKQISGEYTIKYIISENVLKPNKNIELYICESSELYLLRIDV